VTTVPKAKASGSHVAQARRIILRSTAPRPTRSAPNKAGRVAEDCHLETIPLGTRSAGQDAARAAYVAYFTAFPDLTPDDRGVAFGEDVMVSWGMLTGTSGGEWLGVPPSGGSFAVPFTNVVTFVGPLMLGESIYFDLATPCEQANLPVDAVRRAAKERARASRRSEVNT